jgi:hypothetical protein
MPKGECLKAARKSRTLVLFFTLFDAEQVGHAKLNVGGSHVKNPTL